MSPQRPVLRVVLLALGVAALGFAVIAGSLGWAAYSYISARDRATAVVEGTVIEDGIGDLDDIRVRWVDHTGREHVRQFGIYNTDRYRKGSTFTVAYDPTASAPRGFPSDPDETSTEDDFLVPVLIVGLVAVLIALNWALRGILFRRAAKQPARRMVASALAGETRNGGLLSFGSSTWIALAGSKHGSPIRWQRVMWHPVVNSVRGPIPVTVHGDISSARRVVVEMPDQIRLVPIGRLRHRPPKRVVLEESTDVHGGIESFLILPAGTPMPPVRQWWRPAVPVALAGAALGVLVGLLIGSGLAILLAAAASAALLVNLWALAGAEP